MQSVHLRIEGMSCGHCVAQVTSALKKLPGVDVVEVTVGSAEVRFEPSKTSAMAVAEAVTAAGYPAVVQQPMSLPVTAGSACSCCGTK